MGSSGRTSAHQGTANVEFEIKSTYVIWSRFALMSFISCRVVVRYARIQIVAVSAC